MPEGRGFHRSDTDEAQRVLYVAVTRAREELFVFWPGASYFGGGRMVQNKMSRFLNPYAM